MSQLKKLASQTAIYGISSILGRLINYALVPLHTSVFFPEQLGIVAILYSYTALLMVIYTFGMETAYFRFAKKEGIDAYHLTSTAVILISTFFSVILYFNAGYFASLIGYENTTQYVKWLAIIMWIDAILAIPFAKLRNDNRPVKFASAKIINILLNIFLQSGFLIFIPKLLAWQNLPNPMPEFGIGFIFLANIIANALLIPLLFKEISQIRFRLNWSRFKPILIYASPIFIMGITGMLTEQLDKILIADLLPNDFYSNMNSIQATGVYSQTFKLGIFMMLAIQAFRYAGEPFFFAQSEDKNAPELFAKVMHYFVLSGLLLLVLVSINVDFIAFIFLRDPSFRVALYLVPLLLFGKLLYGVYLNMSIWFKLTDKTYFGTYFSIIGVVIVVLGNVFLIPQIGLLACALSIIVCYAIMSVICLYYGQRHYPIPYRFGKLLPYLIGAGVIVTGFYWWQIPNFWIGVMVRLACSLILVVVLYWFEKRNIRNKSF